MTNHEVTILLIEDDVDWAKSYIEDAEEYISVKVIHEIPPRELIDLSRLVERYNPQAIILDELLQQGSDASYLGIDAFKYLSNLYPSLPRFIVTEYPFGAELKNFTGGYGYVIRKIDLQKTQGYKEQHFNELRDAVNSYIGKKLTIESQASKLKGIKPEQLSDDTIKNIARLHFLMDDTIEQVVWFENKERQEIQLVEVNRIVLPTDSVEPFLIPASDEIPIPILVADVTPKEWVKIEKSEIPLPDGWDLGKMHIFEREQTLREG
ncbi:MAG: hypothetical protein Q7U34_09345 [Anaerolineales bacterium]|nr:hypothetical protein [Anaerolineales bacterium]